MYIDPTSGSLALQVLAAAALVAASATPAGAQAHRARLSRDLAERIAQRVEAATEVIVDGSDERIDLLAARYLKEPTGFWRLCDANSSFSPDALIARALIGIPSEGKS